MFGPLIPLLSIFLFACVIILIGLRLSPKNSLPDAQLDQHQGYKVRTTRSRRFDQSYYQRTWVPNSNRFSPSGKAPVKNIFELGWLPQNLRLPLALAIIFGLCLTVFIRIPLWNSTVLPVTLNVADAQTTHVAKPTTPPVQTPSGVSSASKNVQHIAQMDRAQYNSDAEYNTWAASACSAVSMTVVINAYGHHYRVSDILQVEIAQHAIDPDLGLLEPAGINRTVAQLGFRTLQMDKAPLASLISVANNGWPIIIGFPPGAHWPGGHILVMTGGDKNKVYLADSAPSNLPWVTHDRFMQDWGGMALIIIPKDR